MMLVSEENFGLMVVLVIGLGESVGLEMSGKFFVFI